MLQLQCKNDHPGQMFHMRQNSWKQVGSLSWPSASRIYRRVGIISVCSLTQVLDVIAQCIRYFKCRIMALRSSCNEAKNYRYILKLAI